jgi:hypothetical protein
MMGRLAGIAIIILVVAWTAGVAVSAADAGPATTGTDSEIVIADDIEPYFGPLGPDSPLFGLKLALENLDEAFTFNQSEKVMKQMNHAELRIAEIKGLLLMNKSAEAERALDGYFEKLNLTNLDLSRIPVRTTGIATAYQQHAKHQLALWDLLQENPNSTKLRQAYNHTLALEEKFMEKSQIRIEKRLWQLNKVTAKIERFNGSLEDQGSSTATTAAPVHSDEGKGKDKKEEKVTGTTTPVTTGTTPPASDDGPGRDKDKENNGKGPE